MREEDTPNNRPYACIARHLARDKNRRNEQILIDHDRDGVNAAVKVTAPRTKLVPGIRDNSQLKTVSTINLERKTITFIVAQVNKRRTEDNPITAVDLRPHDVS